MSRAIDIIESEPSDPTSNEIASVDVSRTSVFTVSKLHEPTTYLYTASTCALMVPYPSNKVGVSAAFL